MKKRFKITGITLLLLLAFALWYNHRFSMDTVDSQQVNEPTMRTHLLIATQGSEYKDAIVQGLIQEFSEDEIYISVIDVTKLAAMDSEDWNAILILHTWEMWEPQEEAAAFLAKQMDNGAIVVLTTSGEGTHHIAGVDAITGASDMNAVPEKVKEITERLRPLLDR